MVASSRSGPDHFAVFGLPRAFEVDPIALEKRFRELSFEHHPDRHARESARERLIALEKTTALNDAYRTLRDPLRRAAHLLALNGLQIESESGRDSAMAKLPPEFLEEIMELREALVEARSEGDETALGRLVATVKERRAQAIAAVTASLRELPASPDPARLAEAGAALARIRYYDRFDQEVEGRSE